MYAFVWGFKRDRYFVSPSYALLKMNYKEHPTYKEYEKLGFPEISKNEQLRILTNFDYEEIMSKIPDWKSKPFPMGICFYDGYR